MDFELPELGEGVYEAELVEWSVQPGDEVRHGQKLAEVMTDKASMELPSRFRGTIRSLAAEPGETIKVGHVILAFDPDDDGDTKPRGEDGRKTARRGTAKTTAPERGATAPSGSAPTPAPARPGTPKAAPAVRRMAKALGLDLARIGGSGPDGRVLIEDLAAQVPLDAAAMAEAQKDRAAPAAFGAPGTPGTRIKFHQVRRQVAQHMVHAKHTIPHYTYVDECDATELVRLRRSLRARCADDGVTLTYLPFIVKAAVCALQHVPLVNASLDEDAGEIVLHDAYHVGIATATPAGLLVPVVHDADTKDLMQIAREIETLSRAAREGSAALEDMRGGTFTITSIGSIGGLISTPIINHPQVAILGVGKIVRRPVYDVSGDLRPADMLYLSLSFDHRVVDGAVGAVFANHLIAQLQNPAALTHGTMS